MNDDQNMNSLDKTIERRTQEERRSAEIETDSDKRVEGERWDTVDRRGIHVNLDDSDEEFVHNVVTWRVKFDGRRTGTLLSVCSRH
jgi:hypothetical protein|tara:strand:+ start:542 stop:799 length:258 start_codon:yes stop_codon:yes gene_type:complete